MLSLLLGNHGQLVEGAFVRLSREGVVLNVIGLLRRWHGAQDGQALIHGKRRHQNDRAIRLARTRGEEVNSQNQIGIDPLGIGFNNPQVSVFQKPEADRERTCRARPGIGARP